MFPTATMGVAAGDEEGSEEDLVSAETTQCTTLLGVTLQGSINQMSAIASSCLAPVRFHWGGHTSSSL